ncbi:MAG: RluA family pseudouridine synthase [Lachnospiraceae bacterium]|nr:RluA family pseudouridine synthase [Lachnospiraceae bacterium]
MKEFVISEKEEGLTLLKYASKTLGEAPRSLLYKFIRNKNIELNGKKCSGQDILRAGDRVVFFLSDETFEKFHSGHGSRGLQDTLQKIKGTGSSPGHPSLEEARILYEDNDFLFYDKPAGQRSQSDSSGKVSLNDMLLSYTGSTGVFKPSVCNRLDTNTSGIVLCGKSVNGLKALNKAIKDHRIRKYYRTLLYGKIDKDLHLVSFISPSDKDNKVSISDEREAGYKEIFTDLSVISSDEMYTYAEVLLITGRKHQIRAQMAHIGHPVVGDIKYGKSEKRQNNVKRPMLHAYRTELPSEILDGLTVFAKIPEDMQKLIDQILR